MDRTRLAGRLKETFSWQDGRGADPSGWWRDPDLLRDLGPAPAGLHGDRDSVTVVAGVMSRGSLLGPLVAQALGVGFVEVRKDRKNRGEHGDGILRRRTQPDYAQRDLELSIRRRLIAPRDRVLIVDDWIATGAQADAAARLIEDAEGELLA